MKISVAIAFLISSLLTIAQTIPALRTTDWSHAGYPDSIPSPSNILDVTLFGATGNGITDDAASIRSAIDSLHGSRGVVYFPAGNYLVGSTIDLPDSVILRGSSSDSTHILFNFNGVNGNGFNISGSPGGTFTSVRSGNSRGSFSITVDSSAIFNAGDFAELVQDNGTWDIVPAPWSGNSVGQILHITSVSGDTLFFDEPLRINFDTTLNLRTQKIIPAVETGIECMEITRQDSIHTGVSYNIYYLYAANCWIRGVESSRSIGSHIEADISTNISITGCYIHNNFEYDGASTHGYGITLFAHTGQCLVANNIMRHLRHSFSFQTGANGNVLAYNYSREPNRSEAPSDFGADISMHGHFSFANLFEGNIVQNIQIDQTWGPSGPFNTFFRNRAELYGIIMTSGSVQSDSINFVGNEVSNTSSPFMGLYMLAGGGNFEFGNNLKGTISPPGTTPLPDSSYYLPGLPPFWITPAFPTVGIPNTIATGTIPAKVRYLSGSNFTVCEDDFTIGIRTIENPFLVVYPNPASNSVTIRNVFGLSGIVSIIDLHGRTILRNVFSKSYSEYILNLPENIPNGIYIVELSTGDKRIVKKLVVLK